MQAVVFSHFGGPEVLSIQEINTPKAGPGQVVVKVAASTVNPTDLLMRSGQQAASMKTLHPPFIGGFEYAGVVSAIGDGVTRLRPGMNVMGITNARCPQGGSHAEFVLVDAASVVPLSDGVDLVEAATIPMNGLTAVASLKLLGLKSGDTLLVTGGPGAVGGYAIELARRSGIKVIADAFEKDHELLRSLGAHQIVGRGNTMANEVKASYPNGVDGLLDCALIGDPAAALVRDNGTVVSLRSTNPITDSRLTCHYLNVFAHMLDTAALQELSDLLASKEITPRVGARVPLSDARRAHDMVANRTLSGRIVLTP